MVAKVMNGTGAAQVGASSTARAVAQYVKVRRPEAGVMKVMKLVYYAQAYALAWRGRRLFDDELEAWDKGPVVRSLWLDLKFRDRLGGATLDTHDAALVDRMLDMYGDKSGAELSALTHAETPWREARGLTHFADVGGSGNECASAGGPDGAADGDRVAGPARAADRDRAADPDRAADGDRVADVVRVGDRASVADRARAADRARVPAPVHASAPNGDRVGDRVSDRNRVEAATVAHTQPPASKRGAVISTKTMQEFYAAQWELVAPTSLPSDAAHVATSSSEAPTLRLTRLPCLRARSKQQEFHWHLHASSAVGHA